MDDIDENVIQFNVTTKSMKLIVDNKWFRGCIERSYIVFFIRPRGEDKEKRYITDFTKKLLIYWSIFVLISFGNLFYG